MVVGCSTAPGTLHTGGVAGVMGLGKAPYRTLRGFFLTADLCRTM